MLFKYSSIEEQKPQKLKIALKEPLLLSKKKKYIVYKTGDSINPKH